MEAWLTGVTMTITEALASWGSYDLDDPFPVFAEVRGSARCKR